MANLHFLPYLRRGLARHIEAVDPGTGGIGPAEADMGLVVAGQSIATTARLLAPHHVVSLSAAEIVRRYPVPNAVEIEPNYFPLVEFAAPDLPWRFSPAAAGPHGRLRPWLALVVVEADADDIEYTVAGNGLGLLTVAPTRLEQLPPIDDVWAWAHAQSSVAPGEVAAAVTASPGSLRSRLVCPRRMEPATTYRAALVNVFKRGPDERSEPAWGDTSTEPVSLTVYDTWTFTTSVETVNFELLCERLVPDARGGTLGVRKVDVTNPGIEVDWPRQRMSIDLVGALAEVNVITDAPPDGTNAFTATVVPMLNAALGRAADQAVRDGYDALNDDPVVGVPFYGNFPSNATHVPRAGWAREANVQVDARIAAGLGAKTVRRNQESMMAEAWNQLGQIREVSDELNRGRLSAEVGRTWQARVAVVDAGDRVAVAAPLLTFLRVGGEPARKVAARGPAPKVIIDRAWLRKTPRARGASASRAFLKGTSTGATASDVLAFRYQDVAQPLGIKPIEIRLEGDAVSGPILTSTQISWVASNGIVTAIGGEQLDRFVRGELGLDMPLAARAPQEGQPIGPRRPRRRRRPPPHPSGLHRSRPRGPALEIAAAVAAIDPLAVTRASLVARIPALSRLLPAGELPAALRLAPQFTDALFWDLAALDADVIVPGLDAFANNRVRLLAVNPKFVGAYLVGANHEMAREFLWREYPADLGATFFQRFFDYADREIVDIGPIGDWVPASHLSANLPNAAASTVILIRADLVRRYPDVNVFMAPQGRRGRPDYTRAVQPSFEGRLGSDVIVVGFPLAPDVVLGRGTDPEYFVVLEERVTAPRFGLDIERSGSLTTWDELAWTDFGVGNAHIGPGPIGELGTPELDDVVWGRNAAHLAAAVHRRPFRRVYPAGRLISA